MRWHCSSFVLRSLHLLQQLLQTLVAFQCLDLRVAQQAHVVAILNGLDDGRVVQDGLDLRVGLQAHDRLHRRRILRQLCLQLLDIAGQGVVTRRRFAGRSRAIRGVAVIHDPRDVRLRDMHGANAGRAHGVHAIVDAQDLALNAATVLELDRWRRHDARGEAEQYST